MDLVDKFEIELNKLEPSNDEFVLEVDELISSIPTEIHDELIPSIFRFFEMYPLDDCGCPGTLVHFVEDYYPSYIGILKKSLNTAPSKVCILMINRMLNSKLPDNVREEYISLLQKISMDLSINEMLRDDASHYIDYQKKKI